MAKNAPLKNSQKIQLVKWLMNRVDSLNGKTIKEIADLARKELRIYCADSTIKRTIDDGDLGIRYKAQGTGKSIMSQIFARLDRLEAAYIKLCEDVGVTPADMSNITPDEDNA